MRKYMESGFYVIYLVLIFFVGAFLLAKSKEKRYFLYFGLMCLLLGAGDAFHLVPRAIGLFTETLDAPGEELAMWLGIGKLITSITMTVFYLLFYLFIYERTGKKRTTWLDISVCALLLIRVVLCALPQNRWLTNDSPLLWGILRNIPFVILGALDIALAYKYAKIKPYKLLWLGVTLSFGFYLPVVLFASSYSWVGMLMIPKTICYLWIAYMGFADAKINK